MTTLAQLRKAALGLPEVAETTHVGMVAFAVRGRSFISVTDDGLAQLQMSDEAAEAALTHPGVDRLVRTGVPIGVRVPLAEINGKDLNALVRDAWTSRAPKRLAASLAAIEANQGMPGSDLPQNVGKPATRALLTAGITTLDDVAHRTDAELLALHGVGPRAVRLLREALAERDGAPAQPGSSQSFGENSS